VHNN